MPLPVYRPTCYRWILGILLICCGRLLAQQPAYFVLGAEQFKGIQIYDIIQDQQLNYIIATDEGLFYYNYNKFEPFGCEAAKTSAAFSLVMDSEGAVYCCNLNHQVFKIQNKSCSLLYELQEDEISADISLQIGPDGELMVRCAKLIALDKQGHKIAETRAGILTRNAILSEAHELIFHLMTTDSMIYYKAGKFEFKRMLQNQYPPNHFELLNLFQLRTTYYAFDEKTQALYTFEPSNTQMRRMPDHPLSELGFISRISKLKDKIVATGTLPGAYFFDPEETHQIYERYYPNYFISVARQDQEGNILLGTFDRGILVIPDLGIPDVIDPFQNDPVTALYQIPNSKDLYLGTSKGYFYHYDGSEIQQINTSPTRTINGIYGRPEVPFLLFDLGAPLKYNFDKNTESLPIGAVLKDVVFIDAHTTYFATNTGIYRCTWDRDFKPDIQALDMFRTRTYELAYDSTSRSLLASTTKGLFRIDTLGNGAPLLYAGKEIYPTALCMHQENLLVATRTEGILIFQKNSLIGQISPQIESKASLTKLIVQGNHLFAKSSSGLYQLDWEGQMTRNIGKAYGFANARVFDFSLEGDQLWVSHGAGVQLIDLAYQTPTETPLQLRISEILVNDLPAEPAEVGSFTSDRRKVAFELISPSLRNRESLRIYYRLDGYDADWIYKPENETPIVYNALAPGTYRFRAKAENQGRISPEVSYQFSIAAPYYARWWFILSAAALLLLLISMIYRSQLRLQRRKAEQINELNASKLTAIQSQMNPHFIFNALNSIQDLVLKGDIENSYSYITTFSNLVRSALKYSEKDFISFQQEVKLLELYLSLEKLRFKQDLRYEIIGADIEDIDLPPLLIQPFVENALLHGLLHKAGEKVLKIKFELKDALICTVEDNGVGRARAKAIRERQRGDHESFSSKAIRKRFDILSEVYAGQFGYEFEDLEANGNPAGTRIVLTIPVKRRF